jgi:P-type Cu+ transporter
MEQNLSHLEGIRSLSVNYGTSQMSVEYNPALLSLTDIRKMIVDLGYDVLSETIGTSAQDIEAIKLKYLFFVGIAFTIPVILYSYPEVFRFIPIAGTNISAYLTFVFASIVQFITVAGSTLELFELQR